MDKITLKAARVNANLTQTEAGVRLAVSGDTISNWEKGKSAPSATKLKEIERVYGVKYDNINFLPIDTL